MNRNPIVLSSFIFKRWILFYSNNHWIILRQWPNVMFLWRPHLSWELQMSFEVQIVLHFSLWNRFSLFFGLFLSVFLYPCLKCLAEPTGFFFSLKVSWIFLSFSQIIMEPFILLSFIFLYSTNGTVINKLKVVKKQTYPLQTGDVIYVVYRKNEPENSK